MGHVRYYTTKPLSGGITFKCIFCEHTVSTQELDRLNGNLRTQAAAAMNRHAAEMHLPSRQVPALSKLSSRGAF
jgi:hypothetical protein